LAADYFTAVGFVLCDSDGRKLGAIHAHERHQVGGGIDASDVQWCRRMSNTHTATAIAANRTTKVMTTTDCTLPAFFHLLVDRPYDLCSDHAMRLVGSAWAHRTGLAVLLYCLMYRISDRWRPYRRGCHR